MWVPRSTILSAVAPTHVEKGKTMQNIYLIGFMGSGKSTVGAALASHLNLTLLDTDEMIVSRDGRDIPAIFDAEGEPYFRRLEREVISKVAAMEEPCVVSCGGGVVLSEANVSAMRSSGQVIWLTAPAEEILCRVESDTNRPLLSGKKTLSDIETMMESRHAAYTAAADISIDTAGRGVEDIVSEIVSKISV